jgi:hypothetical protein
VLGRRARVNDVLQPARTHTYETTHLYAARDSQPPHRLPHTQRKETVSMYGSTTAPALLLHEVN